MFTCFSNDYNEETSVQGIPFRVKRENELVKAIASSEYPCVKGRYEALFFLGMSVDSWSCSEWWGPREVRYDHSERAFIGEILGYICAVYTDHTEYCAPVIFGVNAWNYDLFCKSHAREKLPCFDAPYDEPFRSNAAARALLTDSLHLLDNEDPEREKNTRWVFGFQLDSTREAEKIIFRREKLGGVRVSAVTGLNAGEEIRPEWRVMSISDFLSRKWFPAADKLMRRLYTFKDEIPEHVPMETPEDFKMPDIRFFGSPSAELYTNVYRVNIDDMQKRKVTADGMPHTSSANTVNFGCYVGLGTYTAAGTYSSQIWTRDVGRLLTELVNLGDFERPLLAADKLLDMLYMPANAIKRPHWKRIANLVPAEDQYGVDLDGKENDGHASVMMFLFTLFNKGAVDAEWIKAREKKLRDASDFLLWQIDCPEESGFHKILFSNSEASQQNYGGFDLYSNVISASALKGFARMFSVIGDDQYAQRLENAAKTLQKGVDEMFLMPHPRFGNVYTDTNEDCWTYEYKRFCESLMYSDLYGYDLADDAPDRYDALSRTFLAQKEQYYNPYSGRQMGYGQGYLTLAALTLDKYEEFTDCMDAVARECYHKFDHNYIVPEGIIMHGSGRYWFRNCDLGNGVQQAEIVKCARLIVGIDDISPARPLRLVPRLPDNWTGFEAKDYPVRVQSGLSPFSFRYERTDKASPNGVTALCEGTGYRAEFSGLTVETLRMGPFAKPEIEVVGGKTLKTVCIGGRWFAIVAPFDGGKA